MIARFSGHEDIVKLLSGFSHHDKYATVVGCAVITAFVMWKLVSYIRSTWKLVRVHEPSGETSSVLQRVTYT